MDAERWLRWPFPFARRSHRPARARRRVGPTRTRSGDEKGLRFMDYMQVTTSSAACIMIGSVESFASGLCPALFAEIIRCFEPSLEFCVHLPGRTELDLVMKTLG